MEVMKNPILEAERNEGRIEGFIEGIEESRIKNRMEGRIEGREEGRIEGREECRAELIRNMLAEGCSLEFVSRISGIAVEDLSCF